MYGVGPRHEAWRRWQAAAGPWVGWSICLPLIVPPVDGVIATDQVRSQTRAASLVAGLTESLCDWPTAIVIDLEPCLGVQVAALLHQQQLAHVVLRLQRWPHRKAILPTGELIATMVTESRRLPPTTKRLKNVAFVLDAERQLRVDRHVDDPRVDNRYNVTAGDLPKLAELRRADIRRILKVTYA